MQLNRFSPQTCETKTISWIFDIQPPSWNMGTLGIKNTKKFFSIILMKLLIYGISKIQLMVFVSCVWGLILSSLIDIGAVFWSQSTWASILKPSGTYRYCLLGRTELFAHYLSKVKTKEEEVNAESLAKKTVGFLGAQIANMVNQAAIKAARDNAREFSCLPGTEDFLL